MLWFAKKSSRSFKNITNKKGTSFHLVWCHYQLYCAFIDFEKAFDKIWREGLWYKLLINNINGKMLNVIQNIYKDIKSNIILKPHWFSCITKKSSEYLLSLSLKIAVKSLPKQLTNVMYCVFIDFEKAFDFGVMSPFGISCYSFAPSEMLK
jgi:hypothetical protein